MRRISLITGLLLFAPGCILAIDADSDGESWWDDRHDEDDDPTFHDDDTDEADEAEAASIDIVFSLDLDVLEAGRVTLLLGAIEGDAGPADVLDIAFEDGIEVVDFAPTGGAWFALVVSADAAAEGSYDLGIDFGDLGSVVIRDAVEVVEASDDDEALTCTK